MTDEDTLTPSQSTQKSDHGCETLHPCFAAEEVIKVERYPFSVGKDKCCDFVIEPKHFPDKIHYLLSKQHFVLKKNNFNEICIIDMSKNGTFVGGKRLARHEPIVLKDGCEIQLAHYKAFIFHSNPKDLPYTQTPSDDEPEIAEDVPIRPIWGRLIACQRNLDSADLSRNNFSVGRSSWCNYVTNEKNIDDRLKAQISKLHFVITRDEVNHVVYVKDCSKWGTYINNTLIGFNQEQILQDNDEISVSVRKIKLFLYKRMYAKECQLPPQLARKYEPTVLLGKGAAGEVILCYNKITCEKFAIKKIMKGKNTTSQMGALNHPDKIHTEIGILTSLSHPFVIGVVEILETATEVYLVLEFMAGGELTNLILTMKPLTESEAKFLFVQMVMGVEFLHKCGVTHRDLKPENILLQTHDRDTLIKVSDFGLSKVTAQDSYMQTICGTMAYIAPEILSQAAPYNRQCDVWSLGVILFYMLTQKLPFRAENKARLNVAIRVGFYRKEELEGVSGQASDLIKKMLEVDPVKRIQVGQIMSHPWISKDRDLQIKLYNLKRNINLRSNDYTCDMNPSPKRPRMDSTD